MRRGLLALLLILLALAVPTLVRYFSFYSLSSSERAEPPAFDPAAVVESVPTPAAAAFVDEPTVVGGEILLDLAHDNQFELEDLGSLDGRLAARGAEFLPFEDGDLVQSLRGVNAFVVAVPLEPYSEDEIQAVTDFVDRGGRLLLVGDPTRFGVIVEEDLLEFNVIIETDKIPLNSLANAFDIVFNGDYLYNTRENEGNFRNIIMKQAGFADSPLTANVEQMAFYGSHSLQTGPKAVSLLAGDDNTWSSATDRPGGLTLAATSRDERVLALGDIQFFTEPYHTVYDNGRFIAHIADFLTEPRSGFVIDDFPYFYDDQVNLVYTGAPDLGAEAFADIIPLQQALEDVGKTLRLASEAQSGSDTLYAGLYNQATDVADVLADNGVTLLIDPPIEMDGERPAETDAGAEAADGTDSAGEEKPPSDDNAEAGEDTAVPEETTRLIQSNLGNVQMSGMALILLPESGDLTDLIVLAASKEGLQDVIGRLLDLIPLSADDALADCLIQANLALCPTGVVNEEVEAELVTGGAAAVQAEEVPAEETPEESGGEEAPAEIDAENQGSIAVGDSVEATLAPDERHAWTIEGPAIVDILLETDAEMDGVLELYDPDNKQIRSSDSPFAGEDESILGAELDDGAYTIVVRDFFDNGGSYTLTVTEGEAAVPAGELAVFYFIDDDGDVIGEGGNTSEPVLLPLLAAYDVQVWRASEDGPLQDDTLTDVDFLIWDSGAYRNEDGFLDEDASIIFAYLDGGLPLWVVGSSPTLLGAVDLALLSDLEVVADDPVLSAGLEAGDVIALTETLETAVSDITLDTMDPLSTAVFLRGPESEANGNVAALAGIDEFEGKEQRTVLMLFPFTVLPETDQSLVFNNMMNWFGFQQPE